MKKIIQQTFMVSALALAVSQVFALPKEPTIVNGNVQITPSSSAMEIQHSAGAIINWKGFDIDNGQSVKFVAPNEQAAILNRVVSGNASTYISGRLESNGRVFLINPNGIIFGYSSVVDVGGLVASTLNITNENFLANNWLFESTGKKNGISINTGSQINIKPNSYLWLFGNRVTNMSTINAQASMVVMAAGEKVYVSENDSSNMFFEVTPNAVIDSSVSDNNVNNNEDAYVDVMQGGHFGVFGYNIIQAGKVYLDSVDVTGGNAIFSAKNNITVNSSSKIYNSGAGQQSGNVYLQAGNAITIDSGSSIRINGDFGGQDGWLTMTAGQINDNGSINAGSSNLITRNYAYNTLATPFFTMLKSDGQQTVIAAGSVFLSPVSPVVTPPTPSGNVITSGVGTVSPPPNTTATTPSSTQSTVEGGGAIQGTGNNVSTGTPNQSSGQPTATEVTPVSNPTNVTNGVGGVSTPVDVTVTNPNPPRLPPQSNTGSQSGGVQTGVVTDGVGSGVISSGVSGGGSATAIGTINSNQPSQVAQPSGQVSVTTVTGAPTAIGTPISNFDPNQPPQVATGAGQTGTQTVTINGGAINSNAPTTPLNNTNPTPPSPPAVLVAGSGVDGNTPSTIQPQTAQQYLATKNHAQLQDLGTQFANAPVGSSVTINVVDANGITIQVSRLEWINALRANNQATDFGTNTGGTVATNSSTPTTVPSNTQTNNVPQNSGSTPSANGGAVTIPTTSTPPITQQESGRPNPTTGNGSVVVNNNTTPVVSNNPVTPTVRPQTIQEYFANKDRNDIKRLFANAPIGNSTIYVTDKNGFSIPVTRQEWIGVMNQKGQLVNDLQSDLEFLKTLNSSEAQSLWNNYNLSYIGESNTAAYPLSNGESRFISRTAWDNDQLRRSQEIYTHNQQAEATSYVQSVSQSKLNDLRINFDQQAYHSMLGNNAQDNKIMVGLPSGTYAMSKVELDQEQARRNVIETERQNKLAAQRALQKQEEDARANSNNFSGSVGSQALDLNYFSQKYQELTSQGKTADAAKLLNNAQSLGFSNESVKGNVQAGITSEQWYAFEDAHYQQQVQQPKQPEKANSSDVANQVFLEFFGVDKAGETDIPDPQFSTTQKLLIGASGFASLNKGKKVENLADGVKSIITHNADDIATASLIRGSKGDWNKIANNPAPNTRYEFDNGYTYHTDSLGRVETVKADLKLDPWDRNTYQQGKVASCGNTDDCGGHLLAAMFGGAGEAVNIVPMNAQFNGAGGAWYQLEQQWKKALQNKQSVQVQIKPIYTTNGKRPYSFDITYSINGTMKNTTLKNSTNGGWFMSTDKQIYQDMGKLLWSVMPVGITEIIFLGKDYNSYSEQQFVLKTDDGKLSSFDFENLPTSVGHSILKLAIQLRETQPYLSNPWTHFKVKLNETGSFSINFAYIPDEKNTVGIFMRTKNEQPLEDELS